MTLTSTKQTTPPGELHRSMELPHPLQKGVSSASADTGIDRSSVDAAYQQGFAAGFAAGKTEECARIQAVEAVGLPGHEALIARLKFDGESTAGDAAMQVLAAEKAITAQRAQALYREAPAPLPPMESLEMPLSAMPLEERCKKEWAHSAALRAEFREVDVYIAYRKAVAEGFVRS